MATAPKKLANHSFEQSPGEWLLGSSHEERRILWKHSILNCFSSCRSKSCVFNSHTFLFLNHSYFLEHGKTASKTELHFRSHFNHKLWAVYVLFILTGVNKMWILKAAERKKQHSGAKMVANPFLLPPNFVHQTLQSSRDSYFDSAWVERSFEIHLPAVCIFAASPTRRCGVKK